MKKIFIVIFVFLFCVQTSFAFYSDVPETHKYYNEIKSLYDQKLLPDLPLLQPDANLTVVDFYKLLLTYSQTPLSKNINLPFKDTDNKADYASYIQTAIDLRILSPIGIKPELKPNSTMTKYSVLTTLFKSLGIGTSYFINEKNFPFKDVKVNSFAAPVAEKAYELGILEEDNKKFHLGKTVTKADLIHYLYKIDSYSPGGSITIEQIQPFTTDIGYSETEKELLNHKSFKTLLDVWTDLKNEYYYKKKIDDEKLIFGAIDGMAKEAGDIYTDFQEPDEAAMFINTLSSELQGIGVILDSVDEKVIVVAPLQDSPAEKAGLKSEDVIIEVNNKDVSKSSLEAVANLIRGKSGTSVKLKVLRGTEKLDFKVKRDFLMLKTIKSEILNHNDKKIGYIAIVNFSKETDKEFFAAAEDLLSQGANNFILDLRSNPGGFLDISVNIISAFTDKEEKAVKLILPDESIQYEYTNGNGLLKGFKTVVLVNEGSASAAEIVAGSLRDIIGAKIIGKTSFGKGTVQKVKQYSDESLFKYTISEWQTPKGTKIEKVGIKPDLTVEGTKEQLQKALEEF